MFIYLFKYYLKHKLNIFYFPGESVAFCFPPYHFWFVSSRLTFFYFYKIPRDDDFQFKVVFKQYAGGG